MKKIIKKTTVNKAQSGQNMFGSPEVRAKAKARRDSVATARNQNNERLAKAKGFVDKEGNADTKSYFNAERKKANKPDVDRYDGQQGGGSTKGRFLSPCKGGGCKKSGDTQHKHGGKIVKKKS